VIVCDTGPLVAVSTAFTKDPDYHRCVELFTGLHLANRQMVLPAPIVAEVGYLLGAKAGARVEASFLRSLGAGDFVSVDLTPADYDRMADLVEQYADLPLGTSDAAVIALAERLDVDEVATLDLRHFTVVRPRHVRALTLLP
jgi:predicted nucleic acid-binding protein